MLKKTLAATFSVVTISALAQTSYNWQHSDVKSAWRAGFQGQGVTVHVHDQFGGDRFAVSDAVPELVLRTAPLASIER